MNVDFSVGLTFIKNPFSKGIRK
uniref:Uncharacterized protein n=1 Tax=Rhizophora mucronata TaxID=61149 RepID=A0A2P2QY83_RHIMU